MDNPNLRANLVEYTIAQPCQKYAGRKEEHTSGCLCSRLLADDRLSLKLLPLISQIG